MTKITFIYTLILVFTITSCKNSRKENSGTKAAVASGNPPSHAANPLLVIDENILKKISGLPKINLPFGSKYLLTEAFPKNWEQSEDESGNILPSRYDRQMTKIVRSYDAIYQAKSIALPQITTAKYINITDHTDSLFLIDIEKFKFKCDYKYRLPDFGPYECYYQSLRLTAAYNEMFDLGKRYTEEYYIEYGNLLFYNPLSKQANILNIYNVSTGNERFGSDYKWFYIDSNKKILIYSAGSGEAEGYFALSQTIAVASSGKIIINNIK